MEDDFFDEYSCALLEEEEDQSVQAFPEPTHSDIRAQDCQAMFMQRDATSSHETQPDAQFYCHEVNILVKDKLFEKVEAKDQNDQDDEDTTQPSPIPSYTPSTAEDYQTPTPYDANVFAFNPHEAKLESSVRAPFEKIICGDDESLQSRGLTEFSVERDPAEEAFGKHLIPAIANTSMLFELKSIELRPTWQTIEEKVEEDLEIPAPRNPFTATEKKAEKKATKSRKVSCEEDEDEDEEKPKNSRQSKYKNAYSLAVEQVKRLIADWFEMTMGCGTKKVKQEEEKSNQVRIEEERVILQEIDKFDAAERRIIEINERITKLQNMKKIRPEHKAEIDSLIKERNSLPVPSESQKKALLEKLNYKRFGLIPYLSQLINDEPNAFIRRAEIPALLKEFPKKRTIKCMREYFSEKTKFGLIVSRVAVEFLSPTEEVCEWELVSRSSLVMKYWLFKTHMKPKTKDLFINKASKNHIQSALKEVYFELEDIASKKLSEHDLKLFESFLGDYDRKLSPIPAFERDIFKIWSKADSSSVCGKRSGKDLSTPGSEKKAKRQSRKKVCQTH